jgi:tetratricopeptide (TPR) repeat protein
VNNTMYGESLEVATVDVPAHSRLLLTVDSAQDFDAPCHSRVRVLRYDASGATGPDLAARLGAFRAWAEATRISRTIEGSRTQGLDQLRLAAAQLEAGDAWLAAWARLVRADLNYVHSFDYPQAARDARAAWAAFEKLGDAHNAARGRFVYATIMAEIANDKTAVDPTAEEAERQARDMLKALAVDPALGSLQRARAVNFRGVRALDSNQWLEAGDRFREALAAFQQLGDRQGQRMVLNNLGVLAAEVGDFRAATLYFDRLVAMLDQAGKLSDRVVWLINAARADTDAGHVDRAISRLLQAQEWNRQLQDPTREARILHALGRAYWARGDLAQASTFIAEGLRVRRSTNDPIGVMASLRYAGIMARESGQVDEAIRMHREAAGLAASADLKLRGLLDLALDYAALPDLRRAIATCREALAQPSVSAEFYKRLQAQLALGDFLLSQSNPAPATIAEAESLAVVPLAVALRRSDTTLELAARHLQARALAARGQWPEARAEYERAIGLIFRYSSASTNPELQASAVAREDATFRGYLDLLMRGAVARGANVLRAATADEMDALRMLEWARATSFTASRAASPDGKTGARIDALLTKMAGKRVRIATLMERSVEPTREVEALQLDIAQMRAEIDRLRAGTAVSTPASSISFLGAPELPALPEQVAQWSYALGNGHLYLWIRDHAGARAAVLPLTTGELERRLAALTTNARRLSAAGWESSVKQLAALLVPRDARRDGKSRVEVVADGPLVSAPFAALLQSEVTMVGSVFHAAPSAGARARALRFVGVAGAVPGAGSARGSAFPALGATTSEARSIAALFEYAAEPPRVKLLLGADATMDALGELWRGGTDVLHIATHGLADLRQPMTSLLMLPARDANGAATYLTAGQVQSWRGDADLVYLSACETAIGPARFADGMPGLQRAFLRAGAHGVIATLWPIEDVYAGEFATDFYRRYTAGMPAPRALAETQTAWMQTVGVRAGEQAHRRMTAWAHAYYTQ